MRRVVFIITGKHKQCGKSTLSRILSEYTGFSVGETSDIILEEFLARHKDKWNMSVESFKGLAEFSSIKEMYRPELIEIGDAKCAEVPHILVVANHEKGHRIISGVRRAVELEEARHLLESQGQKVLVLYVEPIGFPEQDPDNTEDLRSMADIIVPNEYKVDLRRNIPRTLAAWCGLAVMSEILNARVRKASA